MNRETAQKLLPVIQAYAEGKTIQENVGNGRWVDLPGPDFYRKPENYRIKPREPREWKVKVHSLGTCNSIFAGPTLEVGEVITVREILNDETP